MCTEAHCVLGNHLLCAPVDLPLRSSQDWWGASLDAEHPAGGATC